MTGHLATPERRHEVATGPIHWVRSYALMARRDLLALRIELAVMLVFQALMGVGAAFIYGFVLGEIGPTRLVHVATAAPVLALIPVGFVYVPLVIANMKTEGSYDFKWSLPVPRTAAAAATLCVFSIVAIPGAALSLGVASWRYTVDLAVSPSIVPALALTAVMSASVGYGVGHAVTDPRVTNLIVDFVIFFVVMFSPIAFPLEQFPTWFATLHQALPFHHMATIIRAGLTDGLATDLVRSYLVLTLWTLAAWTAALRVVAYRA